MSKTNLFVLLLLVLVSLGYAGGLAYIVYHHPALDTPLTVSLTGAALLVAVVASIMHSGRSQ
ncbi:MULTISPECIES: hypothetical protein [unclassified Streptomyces]|uniref:hypothetical protein n=1 Tax=unclassified Streptomyces TaxID=2593676 RepID=UPI000A1E5533|nr:hypothetical protein [Streptomyces sp. 13-12-16]OSP40045.1 hypothetical protein B7767_28400 [Streptomyces sp. 13-12-16]